MSSLQHQTRTNVRCALSQLEDMYGTDGGRRLLMSCCRLGVALTHNKVLVAQDRLARSVADKVDAIGE